MPVHDAWHAARGQDVCGTWEPGIIDSSPLVTCMQAPHPKTEVRMTEDRACVWTKDPGLTTVTEWAAEVIADTSDRGKISPRSDETSARAKAQRFPKTWRAVSRTVTTSPWSPA